MATILVADDESAIREILERILVRKGYKVVVAKDGREALGLFFEMQPDLVITDLLMPYKDGLTWIAEAREEQPDLRVIYISGWLGSLDISNRLASELDHHPHYKVISKPFQVEELHTLIANYLQE